MTNKTKILIVDDEPKNIRILLEIFEFEDEYITKIALSGEECLAVLPDFLPDIILLDIVLPGLDGYEVCRCIRNNPVYCSTKIMFLSGRAMQNEIDKGIEAGADKYLPKPFSMHELLMG